MYKLICAFLITANFFAEHLADEAFTIMNSADTSLEIIPLLNDGALFKFTQGGKVRLYGHIGRNKNITNLSCEPIEGCSSVSDEYSLTIKSVKDGFVFKWETNDTLIEFQDCLDLNSNQTSWFGGPERKTSDWPVERLTFINYPYISTHWENGAIAERYWLNSKGGYIFLEDNVPLFVDQVPNTDDKICFKAAVDNVIYVDRQRNILEYRLSAQENPQIGHLHAINNYLGKPIGIPNERMVRKPIWTTWAEYKTQISDARVLEFANEIINRGFSGQLEIDDFWETCYGTATFNDNFKSIKSTVESLKELNFTVTLWIHPFINDDCVDMVKFAREKGYLVRDLNGNDFTSWWEGNSSHHIDFTNPSAREWFTQRIKLIQEQNGFDNFKFDAGENDWAPITANITCESEQKPNCLTSDYLRLVAQFGDLLEIRSGWRTQDLPNFVRMQDKDSNWGVNNGLHNLIETLLQMNINGYPFVLPDMIGGNGYGEFSPSAELMVRWTQANAFMPSMQFSYLPWEFENDEFDTLGIIRKFVDLHERYSDVIVDAMKNTTIDGTPVNPPIWWIDPLSEDQEIFKVNDEFLLGLNILVAPVIIEGARSRDIVLPSGTWIDGNDSNKTYVGPQTITNYPVPIDILPYFIRI